MIKNNTDPLARALAPGAGRAVEGRDTIARSIAACALELAQQGGSGAAGLTVDLASVQWEADKGLAVVGRLYDHPVVIYQGDKVLTVSELRDAVGTSGAATVTVTQTFPPEMGMGEARYQMPAILCASPGAPGGASGVLLYMGDTDGMVRMYKLDPATDGSGGAVLSFYEPADPYRAKFIPLDCRVLSENNADISISGEFIGIGTLGRSQVQKFSFAKIITGATELTESLNVPCGDWVVVMPRPNSSPAPGIDYSPGPILVAMDGEQQLAHLSFQAAGTQYECWVYLVTLSGVLSVSVRCRQTS